MSTYLMSNAPEAIGGARVVCYSPIDSRHQFTGNCRQIVAGKLVGPVAGLAICQFPGDDAFYLFGCDADWNCVTDTWHPSLEEAKAQAEFEYAGVSHTWIEVLPAGAPEAQSGSD
jgi:hypothetical protein